MKNESTATCIEKKFIESSILLTYKHKRQTKMMGISKSSPDYEMAKELQPGDKFIIEIRDTEIKPIPREIEIPHEICPLEYIQKIIKTK